MCPPDVGVAEVGAVGLVGVEVTLGNWSVGGGNDGEKEREGAQGGNFWSGFRLHTMSEGSAEESNRLNRLVSLWLLRRGQMKPKQRSGEGSLTAISRQRAEQTLVWQILLVVLYIPVMGMFPAYSQDSRDVVVGFQDVNGSREVEEPIEPRRRAAASPKRRKVMKVRRRLTGEDFILAGLALVVWD